MPTSVSSTSSVRRSRAESSEDMDWLANQLDGHADQSDPGRMQTTYNRVTNMGVATGCPGGLRALIWKL